MRKSISILALILLFCYSAHSQAQWQWTVEQQPCGVQLAGPIQPWLFDNGVVHVPDGSMPLQCPGAGGNNFQWTSYTLPTDICVTNNFEFSFFVRNNQQMGGMVSSDITVEVSTPGGWRAGATFISSTDPANESSVYALGWAGFVSIPTTPLNPPNPYMVQEDEDFHQITLSYSNNTLTVLRDRNVIGTVANNLPNTALCSISEVRVMFKGNGFVDWISGSTSTGLSWTEDFNGPNSYSTPLPANCPQALHLNPSVVSYPSCTVNALVLSAGLPGTPLINWRSPSGAPFQGNQIIVPASTNLTGLWTVTVSNGCSADTATLDVRYGPPTLGPALRKDTLLCKSDTARLTASGEGSYSWSIMAGGSSGMSSTTGASILVWPSVTTTYLATLSSGSCTRVDTFKVTVENCFCEDSCNWSLTGNSNVKERNFIGSKNAADFKIRTNNVQRMVVSASGNVGIGTTAPGTTLEVNSQSAGTSGLRLTQVTAANPADHVLSVDASGNVVLLPAPASGANSWDIGGNTVKNICEAEYIGTNNPSDFRFRTNALHHMRLMQTGSLAIEDTCGSNSSTHGASLMVGERNRIFAGINNSITGNGNEISSANNSMVIGSGNRIGGGRSRSSSNLIVGIGNNMGSKSSSLIIGTGISSFGINSLHVGSGGLTNNHANTMMVGWGERHSLIVTEEGVGVFTSSSNTPGNSPNDLPGTHLDVNAGPFISRAGAMLPSGLRFRDLAPRRGKHLVVDDQGFVYVDGDSGPELDPGGGGVETGREIEKLKNEVAELKQQVQLLMKALQTTGVQPGANSLEIVPTPFDKNARAQYNIEGFSGNALLQVTDASGRVVKSYPVRAAKGAIELGELWSADGVLFFSIIDNGKTLVTIRSIKQSR